MKKISSKEFDEKFDKGEDVGDYLEPVSKRINVDLPLWAIKALDKEAKRIGVARQALIKMWVIKNLDLIENRSNNSKAG